MPLPTPTQHLAPDDVAFEQIAVIGPILDDRPIPEDLNHVVSAEPSSCDREHYAAPALSTPHPARSGFYFVGDFGHATEEIGDVYVWERRWANIPRAYTRPAGTTSYRFPGLQGGSVGSPLTITAMDPAASPASGYVASPTFTIAAHGLAVGAKVRLSLTFTGSGTPVVGSATIVAKTTNTITTTGITLFLGGSGTIGNFSAGTATAVVAYREPKTLPADSIEAFSYALPGVTAGIATPADFRPDELFQPIDATTGEEVDTLGVGTTPTATEYRAQISAGGYLVVESAIRPYLGKILERRTLLGRYT